MDKEAEILEINLDNLQEQGDAGGFLERGRRRKSKNDEKVDRNFICGCGKDYFSYPALYTHIKNKHNGKPPEGTILDANRKKQNKSVVSQISIGEEEEEQNLLMGKSNLKRKY